MAQHDRATAPAVADAIAADNSRALSSSEASTVAARTNPAARTSSSLWRRVMVSFANGLFKADCESRR